MPGLTNNSFSVQGLFGDAEFSRPSLGSIALGRPDYSFNPNTQGGMNEYLEQRGGLGGIKYNSQSGLVYDSVQNSWIKPGVDKDSNKNSSNLKTVGQYGVIGLLLLLFGWLVSKIARR